MAPIKSSKEPDPGEPAWDVAATVFLTFCEEWQECAGPAEGGQYYYAGRAIAQIPLMVSGKMPARLLEPKTYDPDWNEGLPPTASVCERIDYWEDVMTVIRQRAEILTPYIKELYEGEIRWGDPTSVLDYSALTWRLLPEFGEFSYPDRSPQYE
ncbi:MAG TPA: hypothetical protein V6D07_18510 [Trichocoleus sp.]